MLCKPEWCRRCSTPMDGSAIRTNANCAKALSTDVILISARVRNNVKGQAAAELGVGASCGGENRPHGGQTNTTYGDPPNGVHRQKWKHIPHTSHRNLDGQQRWGTHRGVDDLAVMLIRCSTSGAARRRCLRAMRVSQHRIRFSPFVVTLRP